jgi:hypothetical protein
MTEKLTDEQLATDIMRLCGSEKEHAKIAAIFASIRAEGSAERAKPLSGDYSPTEHDRSLAYDIIDTVTDPNIDDHDEKMEAVFLAFASIRAEGSAERAKLEEALRMARDYVALATQWSDHAEKDVETIDAALSQPAESGATEDVLCEVCGCRVRVIESGAKP